MIPRARMIEPTATTTTTTKRRPTAILTKRARRNTWEPRIWKRSAICQSGEARVQKEPMGASDEDELFRAAPRDFTKVRDALVAALAGEPARKAAVKALRRPPAQVWAWNRLMLDGDEAAQEAIEAIDAVAKLLGDEGRDPEELARATAWLRTAGAALARRAQRLAGDEGVAWAPAQERALLALVEALPWDGAAREAARRGRLTDAPPPVDPIEAMRVLASGERPAPAPAEVAPPAPEKPARARKRADDDAARAAKQAAAERAAHERALADAERAHTAAASALAAARAELDRAEREVARAQAALEEAQRRADEALAEERLRAAALDEARARLTSH